MGARIAGVIAIWLSLSVAGLYLLAEYKATPGVSGNVPAEWPADTQLTRADDRPTLVFIAHPRCVCTRASLSELAELVSAVAGRVRIHVLFVRPEGVSEDWMETDLLDRAHAIAGAEIGEDLGGVEAERFGAGTSGQVAVFDPAGRRLYQGGITGARGHVGENAGLARAVASVRDGTDSGSAGVFGCALTNQEPEFSVEER